MTKKRKLNNDKSLTIPDNSPDDTNKNDTKKDNYFILYTGGDMFVARKLY